MILQLRVLRIILPSINNTVPHIPPSATGQFRTAIGPHSDFMPLAISVISWLFIIIRFMDCLGTLQAGSESTARFVAHRCSHAVGPRSCTCLGIASLSCVKLTAYKPVAGVSNRSRGTAAIAPCPPRRYIPPPREPQRDCELISAFLVPVWRL